MELESTEMLSWTWHHCDCNRGLEIYCKAQKHLKWTIDHSIIVNVLTVIISATYCFVPSFSTGRIPPPGHGPISLRLTPFIHPFMDLSPTSVHTRALSLLLLLSHWVNMALQDLNSQISPGKKRGKKTVSSPDLPRKTKTHSALPRYFTEDLTYWYNYKYQSSSL